MRIAIVAELIALAVILIGCQKCETYTYNYSMVDSTFFAMMPYTGTDTLYFLHNNSHSDTFLGQGLVKVDYDIQPLNSQGSCPDIYHVEKITCNYKNISHKGMDILFSIHYAFYQDHGQPDKHFSINYAEAWMDETQYTIIEKMRNQLDSIVVNGDRYSCIYLNVGLYYSTKHGIIKWTSTKNSLQKIN
ncbi:MAG: hypothetical protein Q8M15_06155 [Bacteroidota bacterium]|nr:hypothetical protein [Bacteroidota bacterium]